MVKINTVIESLREITREIECVERKIKRLPEGKIYCAKNNKHYKWYYNDGKNTRKYIPKEKVYFAQQLAYKKYLTIKLKKLETEKYKLQAILEKQKKSDSEMDRFICNPAYIELLKPYNLFQTDNEWMKAFYEKNLSHPEQLKHKSIKGYVTRSKAESMILRELVFYNIPFRYEWRLQGVKEEVFPDFTIRIGSENQYIYWEHFGIMDSDSYNRDFCWKMRFYTNHGITPGDNLIMTFEDKEHPLTYEAIDKTIEFFLLKSR